MGLESVELFVTVEKEFGIEIPDSGIETIQTVGDFYDIVLKQIQLQKPELVTTPGFNETLWQRIARLSADLGYRVNAKDVTRKTRFIEDLGYG